MDQVVTGLAAQRAAGRYAEVGLTARTAQATPYDLVVVLYDELLLNLDIALRAQAADNAVRTRHALTQSMLVLRMLDSGLDPAGGGALATTLGGIYRQMLRHLQGGEPARVAEVRDGVANLADAWNKLQPA